MLALAVVLLTVSYAPWKQFYLAWVALVPWLLFVARAPSTKAAFWWSWLTGLAFYAANMWWLGLVTLPGTAALLVYMALYWGLAAIILRNCRLLPVGTDPYAYAARGPEGSNAWRPVAWTFGAAALWVALEWLRGWLFWGGLPWLYLGHSQTPLLAMCQIADVTGAYGVSFWVVLINMVVALVILRPLPSRQLAGTKMAVALLLLLSLVYGIWRMNEWRSVTEPGPKVMVVQSNLLQTNDADKSQNQDFVGRHFELTRKGLLAGGPTTQPGEATPPAATPSTAAATAPANPKKVQLVVWSETVNPPLNAEFGQALRKTGLARLDAVARQLQEADQAMRDLAARIDADVVTGAYYVEGIAPAGKGFREVGKRNSVYLYPRGGAPSTQRYDKIHLVPFGEFIPFKESLPPLHALLNTFNPYGYDYDLTSSAEDAMTVFSTPAREQPDAEPWRFVTPICFEDIDARLVAAMFRPADGETEKRADFLVNVTNDGWFRFNQNALHFQTAIFRSIENRVPSARSVNTGVSGFIDSLGRAGPVVGPRVEDWAIKRLQIDRRVTFYTLHGDAFALGCLAASAWIVGRPLWRWGRNWIGRRSTADKK
jgi:apolipoprotein N-acyltransferase